MAKTRSSEYQAGAENARFQIADLGLARAVKYFESKADYILSLTSPRLLDWWEGFGDVIVAEQASTPGYYASEEKEIAYDEKELL